MTRSFLFLIINLLFIQHAWSQNAVLTLVIPQNVYLPGQPLWYGILLDESTGKVIDKIKQYPTTYIALVDKNNKILYRSTPHNKSSVFTASLSIPKSIIPGTYILTASLYNTDISSILEEHAVPIQILGGANNQLFTFSDDLSCNDSTGNTFKPCPPASIDIRLSDKHILRQYIESDTCSESMKSLLKRTDQDGIYCLQRCPQIGYDHLPKTIGLRENLCLENIGENPETFISISKFELLLGYKIKSFIASKKEYQYGFNKKVRIDAKYQMPGFYDSRQTQIYQFKRSDVSGDYNVIFPYFEQGRPGQYIDMITKENIKAAQEIYPNPKWPCTTYAPLEYYKSRLDSLQFSLEKNEIISRIFNQPAIPVPEQKSNSKLIEPDNFFDLSRYQLFETTQLFLQEAADPVRLFKSRKEKKIEIRLLRDDVKAFYTESPLLIINGKIQRDLNALFQIPYKELKGITLYRRINETRKAFGPLGRFGVIELTTKSTYFINGIPDQSIKGFEPNLVFPNNGILYDVNDPTPKFNPLQYFGRLGQSQLCYMHNDEMGSFLLQLINSNSRKTFGLGAY